MPMDHIALAGTDSGATNRRKAWEALGKWVNSRLSRQRGVNFPSFFQIVWKNLAADESGSKLRRPVFALSERFSENFGVKQAGARERGLPAPAAGDDVNFYQVAIQHAEGLTKDAAYTSVKEMLYRLGEAAAQGKDMRLAFGHAGHLVVEQREASFEFAGGFGGGGGGGGERTSHLDPMLNGKQAGGGSVTLSVGGSMLEQPTGAKAGSESSSRRVSSRRSGGGGGSSMLGYGGGGSVLASSVLTEEEEAALFADVDALDPETVLRTPSNISGASGRPSRLEGSTRDQVAAALKSDPNEVGGKSIEELGAALGARAAALEAQLKQQKKETDAIEAKLKKTIATGGVREATRSADRHALAAVADARREQSQRLSKPPGAADPPRQTRSQSKMHTDSLEELMQGTSGLGIGIGGGARSDAGRSRTSGASSLSHGGKQPIRKPTISEIGPPVLSVGLTQGGPGTAGHVAPQAPPPRFVQYVPVVAAALSDTSSQRHAAREERAARRALRVPVAPPLPPFRFAAPDPDDAAARAWKKHAAPTASKERKPAAVVNCGRSVGGPAPPFLAAPPVVAAAAMAKAQAGAAAGGRAWAG